MDIVELLLALLMNAFANVFIKAGMRNYSGNLSSETFKYMVKNPYVVLGLLLFGGAFIVYSHVLSKIDLSVAYPIMTGAGFAVVAVISSLWFGEGFGFYRILGTVLIVFGIWMISRGMR